MGLLTAQRILGVTREEAVRLAARQAARLGQSITHSGTRLVAHVNHGRWLVLCPCGAGVAVSPDWPKAYCFDCATDYDVRWPLPVKQDWVERALLVRPLLENRHWAPPESVAQLVAENRDHGLGQLEVPGGVD